MIHICYGLHDKFGRYSKFIGTSMLSIFENTKFDVTVHILHDETLRADNREKFLAVTEKYNQCVKFYNVEKICAAEINAIRKTIPAVENSIFTIGAYYRLFIPQIISPDIEKVIYLDGDTLVNFDINEFWQIELFDKPLAAGAEKEVDFIGYMMNPPRHYLIASGLVHKDDYFVSGVMLMNLKNLREQKEKIQDGLKFLSEHPQCKYADQEVLNYCFSKNYVKLPKKIGCFVGVERALGGEVQRALYHYAGVGTIDLNLQDKFNRLWFDYFTKTAWFNLEVVQRIYECVQGLHAQAQNKLIELTAKISGRRRIFFAELTNFEAFRQIFRIGKDEEILDATKPDALKILLKKMKKLRGDGFFILLVRNYAELKKFLTEAGYVEGKDFVDATKFFSYAQGMPLDTHFFISAI